VYLVGVIPGPTKPSAEQIDHFLAILVEELLEFWNPGVWFSRTAKVPHGRKVLAALIPLVCDLVAARQIAGLGAHNHAISPCSLCDITSLEVEETDPEKFPPRSLSAHLKAAQQWLEADTLAERQRLFKKTGIRHSELLRLPYWNPILYIVVDTMHNLYLGLISRHIRDIWGINEKEPDGIPRGCKSPKAPPRPPKKAMLKGIRTLCYGSDEALQELSWSVIFHLCKNRGLRRAGSIALLASHLREWIDFGGGDAPPAEELTTDSHAPTAKAPLTAQEMEEAEAVLRKSRDAETLSKQLGKVLQALCKKYNLASSGNKLTLATRLMTWVCCMLRYLLHGLMAYLYPSSTQETDTQSINEPLKIPRKRHGGALGINTLAAFREDRERMELPSWLNAAPAAFGTTQHGKLSADQWRTVGTLNMPITLIRTWGAEQARRLRMLTNFLDLVEAVETIGLLEITEEEIERAEIALEKYVAGLKSLYKEAKIQTNHHLALHLGVFIRLFGPVHSWRAFVFERMNYVLQSTKSSNIFGNMEISFMLHACRAATLRPLLRSPHLRPAMEEFIATHQRLSGEDRRGMRFDDLYRTNVDKSPRGDPGSIPKRIQLDGVKMAAIVHRLNAESGRELYIDGTLGRGHPGQIPLFRAAVSCARVAISGVFYKPQKRSRGDSNIIFGDPKKPGVQRPGRIHAIVLFSRDQLDGTTAEETFLFVKQLQDLSLEDAKLDPFRRYGSVGGRLYYDATAEETIALRPADIVCHFARTRMGTLTVRRRGEKVRLSKACVHVRHLDRVS
ncbi:hypothetical protein C8Q76DRAFT_584388, partial [Earliella scabrosa]